MKRLLPVYALLSLGSALLLGGCAGESSELESVRDRLSEALVDIEREDIRPSPIPGLYEVQQGMVFAYATADGRYLINGDMVDMRSGKGVTEAKRRIDRLERLKVLDDSRTITFAPEKTKYQITVFTDIDCGYCRRLHRELADYHAEGIAVRYVFYPRSGPQTESFQKAVAVWCAADRKDALTRAKAGQPQDLKVQCDNPVMADYQLGQELGLRGTPLLVLPNGDTVNGYLPAPALLERLKNG